MVQRNDADWSAWARAGRPAARRPDDKGKQTEPPGRRAAPADPAAAAPTDPAVAAPTDPAATAPTAAAPGRGAAPSWADLVRTTGQAGAEKKPTGRGEVRQVARRPPAEVVLSRSEMLARFAESPERRSPEPQQSPAAPPAAAPAPAPQPVSGQAEQAAAAGPAEGVHSPAAVAAQPGAPEDSTPGATPEETRAACSQVGSVAVPKADHNGAWCDVDEALPQQVQGCQRSQGAATPSESTTTAAKRRAATQRRFEAQASAVVLPAGIGEAANEQPRFVFSGAARGPPGASPGTPQSAAQPQPRQQEQSKRQPQQQREQQPPAAQEPAHPRQPRGRGQQKQPQQQQPHQHQQQQQQQQRQQQPQQQAHQKPQQKQRTPPEAQLQLPQQQQQQPPGRMHGPSPGGPPPQQHAAQHGQPQPVEQQQGYSGSGWAQQQPSYGYSGPPTPMHDARDNWPRQHGRPARQYPQQQQHVHQLQLHVQQQPMQQQLQHMGAQGGMQFGGMGDPSAGAYGQQYRTQHFPQQQSQQQPLQQLHPHQAPAQPYHQQQPQQQQPWVNGQFDRSGAWYPHGMPNCGGQQQPQQHASMYGNGMGGAGRASGPGHSGFSGGPGAQYGAQGYAAAPYGQQQGGWGPGPGRAPYA
eukprot:TRINITY_DN3190_c0_g3_i1.p1 TRINITY_DN3190_c0_g3~~TRINITY_DN3190_c0_g3_i1.p1  ORF type:complete len:671 (+),score=182.83 TRINITY_DN3190_c0_g3_i1:104-2014(+)